MSDSYEIYKTGRVVNGELQGISRKKLKEELAYFNDKNIELIIRKKKKYRSIQQNRLYWLYMTMLGEYLGYTKEQMHEIVKFKFLKKEAVDETTGQVFEYVESTSKLTTTEFMELIEQLYQWSSETFGVVLPEPNEQLKMEVE